MYYTCFLFSVLLNHQYSEGFSNIAVSSYLFENQQIATTGWSKITKWIISAGYGSFTSSVSFDTGEFNVIQSGLYQLFTTITFSGAQTGFFKVALVYNNDLSYNFSGLSTTFQDSVGYRSLSVFGTARLYAGDIVSVYVFSELDTDWLIRGNSESTFCIQFVGFYNQVPGFSSYLTQDYNVDDNNWNRILKWNTKDKPGLFKSRTGFSQDVGEFVSICDGIYQFSANILISTSKSGRFDVGIALNGISDGSITGADINSDLQELVFSLSISISLKLSTGDSVVIVSRGSQSYSIKMGSGFFGIMVNKGGTVPGISSMFNTPVVNTGGAWLSIPIPIATTGNGQFTTPDNSVISNGRFFFSETRIFMISAIINVQSASSSNSLIISMQNDPSTLSSQRTGLFTTNQRTSVNSSYSIAGILELPADQPLFMYVYLLSQGDYSILTGSRVCITTVQQEYESFNVVIPSPVDQTIKDNWVVINTWSKSVKSDSFVFTEKLSSGKYTAMATGIYYLSANIIFKDCNGPIYVMIAVDNQLSKRTSLYTTKGKPSVVQDSLSVSGALFIKKDSYVNVFVMMENDNSWSIDADSTFSMVFLGYQSNVFGVTTVLSVNLDCTSGWTKITKWKAQTVAGPFFDFGGAFYPDTGDFIALKSGFYIISAGVKMIQASAVGSSFTLNVAVNGNPSSYLYQNGIQDYLKNDKAAQSTTDFYSLIVSGLVSVNTGDSISLYIKSEGDNSYTISQDSFASIVFVGPNNNIYSSGMQLMLNTVINQQQSAADWFKVKNWESSRLNTAPGVFSSGNLLALDQNLGTVTVQATGIYMIFVNLAVSSSGINFQFAVHTTVTAATLITRYSEIDRTQYTMKVFGTLYLYKGQVLSVKVKPSSANAQWENLRPNSGWSLVRIPPYMPIPSVGSRKPLLESLPAMKQGYFTRLRNWSVTMSTNLGVEGEGLNQKDGIYTASLGGVYLVSTSVVIKTNESQVSIGLKIGINANLSDVVVIRSGVGPSYSLPLCSGICTIYITQAVQLLVGHTVAVFIQSNAQTTYVAESSRFSLKLLLPLKSIENGFSCQFSSELKISSSGEQKIIGWSVPETIHYKNSAQVDEYSITSQGLYLAAFNIDLLDLKGFVSIKTFSTAVLMNLIEYFYDGTTPFTLSSAAVVYLYAGDTYSIKVNAETDSSYSIGKPSSSSLTFIGDNSDGFSAVQSKINSNFYNQSQWYPVGGWTTVGSGWLFEMGSGFLSKIDYIVEKSGFFFISANVIFDKVQNENFVELVVVLNKIVHLLHDRKVLSSKSSTTSMLRGGVYLNKLDYLQLQVRLGSNSDTLVIKKESSFSIVRIGVDTLSTTCVDNGPNILGELASTNTRLGLGENVIWDCSAVGSNVTYQWMKNFQPLQGMTSQLLQILNAKSTDSGTYFCAAVQNKVRVSSNIAKIVVFDTYPVFLNPPSDYNITAMENGPQVMDLLKISVKTQSLESNLDEMFFDIVEGNDLGFFQLYPSRSTTGTTLTRIKPLDRETTKYYKLKIKAANVLRIEFSTNQSIWITVLDENDNSPVFDKKIYNVSVLENSPIGTVLLQMNATDLDEGQNAIIIYSIVPIVDSNLFAINSSSGLITVAANLDREVKSSYVIVIEASNIVKSVPSSYAQVYITVLDVNEFEPYWLQDTYNVDISEILTPGIPIKQLLATDNDSGLNALIKYTIVSGNEADLFDITPTGMLVTKGYFSYKSKNIYVLKVHIEDSGSPPKSGLKDATVTVNILNSNGNKPIFEKPEYIATVTENSLFFNPPFVVKAGSTEVMQYSIPSNQNVSDIFAIGPQTGIITLKRSLDYEQATFYQFTVQASDSGVPPTIAKTNVLVKVIDVNDNAPLFLELNKTIYVQETSSVGKVVYRVSAIDKDSGTNGIIGYKIVSGNTNNVFYINSYTGDVTTQKPLDRESNDHFILNIIAFDFGVPSLESSAFTLEVFVTDINDNAPMFDLPSYAANIYEDQPINSTLFSFAVQDADLGINSLFNVTLSEYSSFSIKENGKRFDLILSGPLDYNKRSLYQFFLEAKDFGVPPLSSLAPVTVKINQVNRYAPSFAIYTYTTTLSDTSIPDQFVSQLVAVDPDLGPEGRLKYTIVSGNEDGAFEIDMYTGIVYAKPRKGFQFSPQYQLSITAEDSFKPPKVSPPAILFVRVSTIPRVLVDNVNIGSYQFQATISLKEFAYLQNANKLQVLVQRYAPSDSSFAVNTLEKPTTWFQINYNVDEPKLTRYIAVEKFLPLSQVRVRRSVINITDSFSVVIGENTSCASIKTFDNNSICNGPLKAGLAYRLQLRVYEDGNIVPIESSFSDPVTIPNRALPYLSFQDTSQDGMVVLASAFGAICFLSFIVVFIYVCWKQRHEILYNEHLKEHTNRIGVIYDRSEKPSPSNPNTFYSLGQRGGRFEKNIKEESGIGTHHVDYQSIASSQIYSKQESKRSQVPILVLPREGSLGEPSIEETDPSEHLYALADEMSKKQQQEMKQKEQESENSNVEVNKSKRSMSVFDLVVQMKAQEKEKNLIEKMRHSYEQNVADDQDSSVEYESAASSGGQHTAQSADNDDDGSIIL